MHDPTEGGIATGLWELAMASRVGLEVDAPSIPVFEETKQLCAALDLDPMGVIASGALLIAVSEKDVTAVREGLAVEGIASAPIAKAVRPQQGLILMTDQGSRPLPRYDQDEIARLF
jgi:hydrogenase maturation factor